MERAPSGSAPAPTRLPVKTIIGGVLFIAANVALFLALRGEPAQQWLRGLGEFAYAGAFLVMFLANATIVVPVPWPAILLTLAAQVDTPLILIVAATAGSIAGESVAFFIGRAGRGIGEGTRAYAWIHQQLQHPWRAWFFLCFFSFIPNPLFDIAGITAGALGLQYWIFLSAVGVGRALRLSLFVLTGLQFG